MLGRERFIYTFMLLLYIIAGMSRVLASKSSYATNMQICSAFNTQLLETAILPIPQTPIFAAEDPLSAEQLMPRMAGSKEDCELGLQVIRSTMAKNALTSRQFNLLLKHPLFTISFDFPAKEGVAGQAGCILDRCVIYFNPSNPNVEEIIRHELTHLFLGFVQTALFDAETFPVNIQLPDIGKLYQQAGEKATYDELKKVWLNKVKLFATAYQKHIRNLPLTENEYALFRAIKKAVKNNPIQDTIITIPVAPDKAQELKIGSQYPVSELEGLRVLSKNSDYFILEGIQKRNEKIVDLYINIRNPLLAFLAHQIIIVDLAGKYDPTTQQEESIAYAAESSYPDAARILYPEIFDMLEYYIHKLETTYEPREFMVDPLPIMYAYKLHTAEANVTFGTRQDLEIAYSFVTRVIRKQESATEQELDLALSSLSKIIKHKSGYINKQSNALNRVLFGEVFYLRGKMKLAAAEYEKAYKLDKAIFKLIENSLQHRDEAIEVSQNNHVKKENKARK